jgi:hypothetical protein
MSRSQKGLRKKHSSPQVNSVTYSSSSSSSAQGSSAHGSTLALSTLKHIAFAAAFSALHGVARQLVLVAQLGPVVAVTARRKLGSADAAARGELGGRLVFVVDVATRQGPGTMVVHVAAVATRRGLRNHARQRCRRRRAWRARRTASIRGRRRHAPRARHDACLRGGRRRASWSRQQRYCACRVAKHLQINIYTHYRVGVG